MQIVLFFDDDANPTLSKKGLKYYWMHEGGNGRYNKQKAIELLIKNIKDGNVAEGE